MERYDVIVVGAGNGGLSAAAAAAKSGLRTLVVERNIVPGGCATSFRRGRFEFEASLHELANVGTPEKPGSVGKLLAEYEIHIRWHTLEDAFRVIVPGEYDVTMPTGIDDFCQEIERQSPGSRESVEDVFRLVEQAGEAFSYMGSGRANLDVMAVQHSDFLRMASHTVEEVLEALCMPRRARQILSTYWPYLGVPTDRLDFLHYAVMLSRYVSGRPSLPELRSHEISLALESSIRRSGGEVWYGGEVSRILVQDGCACGVVVNGREIYAQRVVCNVFPDTVYSRLVDLDTVPRRAAQLSHARQIGPQFFTVYLGLNRSSEELGIRDYSVFLFDSPDPAEQFASCNDPMQSFIIVNCLNRIIPDSSPPGTCTLFFTTMLTWNGWGQVRPEEYKRRKDEIAESMIKRYEQTMGISVRPHIEEIVIAAPPTFARYLNTPGGTPYGYELSLWDSMALRMANRERERFIKGLYFVGAHGERGDGYSSAYSNGHSVGRQIGKELNGIG